LQKTQIAYASLEFIEDGDDPHIDWGAMKFASLNQPKSSKALSYDDTTMSSGIFSVYSTPENRVTAAVLSVLTSLSLARSQRILANLLQVSDFQLVRFKNQASKGAKGIPDGEISSSFRVLIETKIAHGAVDEQQLRRHLARLDSGSYGDQYLLVLTPDSDEPQLITALGDARVIWASFEALHQAIDELLGDRTEVISEREAFLMRELQALLSSLGLLSPEYDTVVVAARSAWHEYLKYGLYVCQADRTFRKTAYMAFYADSEIKPVVAKIVERVDQAELKQGIGGALGAAIDDLLADNPARLGSINQVFLLSRESDSSTLTLPAAIPNDTRAKTGRGWAFVLSQTYVMLDDLQRAQKTSDLRRL